MAIDLSIDIAAVRYSDDRDFFFGVANKVNYPPISYSNPPYVLVSAEFLAPRRPGILAKLKYFSVDAVE